MKHILLLGLLCAGIIGITRSQPLDSTTEARSTRLQWLQDTLQSAPAQDTFTSFVSQQPDSILYVIDGKAQTPGAHLKTHQFSYAIKSIRILPSGAARFRYGEKGKYGAVIITTNSYRQQRIQIGLKSSYGVQFLARKRKMADANTFAAASNTARQNAGLIRLFDGVSNAGGTDWQDEISRIGQIRQTHLTLNHRQNQGGFYVSLGHHSNPGIIRESAFQRNNAIAKFDYNIRENLQVLAKVHWLRTDTKGMLHNRWQELPTGLITHSLQQSPLLSTDRSELMPESAGTSPDVANPLRLLELRNLSLRRNAWLPSAFLRWNISSMWTLQARSGWNHTRIRRTQFEPDGLTIGPSFSFGNQSAFRDFFYHTNLQFDIERNGHGIAGLLLFEQHLHKWQSDLGLGMGLPDASFSWMQADSTSTQAATANWQTLSQLLQMKYRYRDWYYLDGWLRLNRSSIIRPGERWRAFGGIGMTWVFSEHWESYWLSYGKLRLSHARTGSEQFHQLPQLSTSQSDPISSLAALPQPFWWNIETAADLGWQQLNEWSAGLETQLFNSRLKLTVDVYKKNTRNQLLISPATQGGQNPYQLSSVAHIRNSGIETMVEAYLYRYRQTRFEIGGSFTLNCNLVVDAGNAEGKSPVSPWSWADGLTQIESGGPLGTFWGYTTDGLYQVGDNFDAEPDKGPGDIKLVDTNQDGIISEEDRTRIGNALPDFFYGFFLRTGYKGWNLLTRWNGSFGNEILDYALLAGRDQPGAGTHLFAESANYWRPDNPDTNIPRPSLQPESRITDRLIQDASFIRLSELQLSYTWDRYSLADVPVSALKIYVLAENLLLFTPYSGYDPEVNSFHLLPQAALAVDYGAYPRPRSFVIGLDVKLVSGLPDQDPST